MKPVDPIHFFNSRGESVLTIEHLQKQLAAKDVEIEKLKSVIRHQAKKSTNQIENRSED